VSMHVFFAKLYDCSFSIRKHIWSINLVKGGTQLDDDDDALVIFSSLFSIFFF
jgi:hypothetical protein